MKFNITLFALAGLALAGCQTTSNTGSGYHTVAGKTVVLGHVNNVYPDCRANGVPVVRATVPASNGMMVITQKVDYPKPGFLSTNVHFKCNKVRILGTSIAYKPNPGFVGTDSATVEYIYPSGRYNLVSYTFHVK